MGKEGGSINLFYFIYFLILLSMYYLSVGVLFYSYGCLVCGIYRDPLTA